MTKEIAHILQSSNGYFYCNIKIPENVVGYYRAKIYRKSLGTKDYTRAVTLIGPMVDSLRQEWRSLSENGTTTHGDWDSYRSTLIHAAKINMPYVPATNMQINQDLLHRVSVARNGSLIDSNAALGLVERPAMLWSQALSEYEKIRQDFTINKSENQIRKWRNPINLAIGSFIKFAGDISLDNTTKRHAMEFRQTLIERIKVGEISASTANKQITHLRKVYTIIADAYEYNISNPFSKVRLEEKQQQVRYPLSIATIQNILLDKNLLSKTNRELQALVYIMASTGMRPVEILGLEAADIILDHSAPHVILRPNSIRELKTEYSDRRIPILGTAYGALREFHNGFDRYRGKNDSATSTVAKFLRENNVFEAGQSLYSLRHTFQDKLTAGVVIDGNPTLIPDRIQTQLMGHKFDRPIYGDGATLDHLQEIVRELAFYRDDDSSCFNNSHYDGR